jgi:hypothetical protein
MRWVSLFALCAATCAATTLFDIESAGAANDGFFRIADWVGRAYWSQEKQFDHCSAQLTNTDNITIIYSLDRQYKWNLELSSPAWNFVKGASFPVTFRFGKRGSIRQPAIATEAQLVRVELSDSLSAFESLRSIIQFELIAGGLNSNFNVAYNNQVLIALTRCAVRYSASSRSRAAIAAWLKSVAGPGSNIDPSIQREAATLATNIMTEAAIPKAASLQPNEVPAALTGDAFWRAGEFIFAVSVLSNKETSEIAELPSLIIGGGAQKCRGDFFSGAITDVIDALRVARAFTSCQTQEAATSVYYLIIPRKQGGLYLLATITNRFEITAPGLQTARDVDSMIRASINVALAKMQQTNQ